MEITYLGHSAFRLKGKNVTIVTDPYESEMVGLKFPKHVTGDIVTISHDHGDHNAVSQIEGNPFIVNGPGEYEIKGVSLVGISVYHDDSQGRDRGKNTIYRIEVDGISVVHLGDLGHKLTTEQIDSLDGVNIVLVPVGGTYTIDAVAAAAVVNDIEPAIVIPMHYGKPELHAGVVSTLQPLTVFLKEMGKEEISPQTKLIVAKDKLPQELQLVVLE